MIGAKSPTATTITTITGISPSLSPLMTLSLSKNRQAYQSSGTELSNIIAH
jgi:hypothetical protein